MNIPVTTHRNHTYRNILGRDLNNVEECKTVFAAIGLASTIFQSEEADRLPKEIEIASGDNILEKNPLFDLMWVLYENNRTDYFAYVFNCIPQDASPYWEHMRAIMGSKDVPVSTHFGEKAKTLLDFVREKFHYDVTLRSKETAVLSPQSPGFFIRNAGNTPRSRLNSGAGSTPPVSPHTTVVGFVVAKTPRN